MSLLRLPTEIILDIIDRILKTIGVRRILLLRTVCRLFQDSIHSVVFALPTFESLQDDSTPLLTRDPLMAQTLVFRLILYKLKAVNAHTRPLCHAIHNVAAYLKESIAVEISIKYMATLASIEMNLHEIVSSLEPAKSYIISHNELLDYALIVASGEGKLSLVKSLCGQDARVVNTQFFGSAVAAAARSGHTDVVAYLLGQGSSEYQFMMAVDGAATAGQHDLVKTLLNGRIVHPSPLFDRTIINTLRRNKEETAALLLRARKSYDPQDTLRGKTTINAEEEFQINLLRTAVELNNIKLIAEIFDNDVPPQINTKSMLLEDACRFGHGKLIDLLLLKSIPPSNEALFWAAYHGKRDLVDRLSSKLQRRAVYDALAAAYSVGDIEMINHLLQKLGSPNRTSTFNGLINQLITDKASPVLEDQFLLQIQANDQGHLLDSLLLPTGHKSSELLNSLSLLAYYGVSLQASHLTSIASESKSIATLYMCYLHGWSINQECNPVAPPPLWDEQIVLWYLKHGADPNESCTRVNATPMSLAVLQAPLSVIFRFFNNGAMANKGQLLHWAVRRNDRDSALIIDLIVHRGALINEIEVWEGREIFGLGTPLHTAVGTRSTNVSIIEALLRRGADRSIVDSKAKTPLEVAQEVRFDEAIRLLMYQFMTRLCVQFVVSQTSS